MPQNQPYQTMDTTSQNPAQATQVPTVNNMPSASPQHMLSFLMGVQPGPRWANWDRFGGPQTPGYSSQTAAPVTFAPQAPNPQYPGTSGQITGQQPVAPPSTQPDMNSVMNNLVSGASQNLGGAQAQPQIHPAIQQFQGMLQGLQANPQMAQAIFGSMPGGLQGFMNLLQPLMSAIPMQQASRNRVGAPGSNLSQGALAMLKNLSGNKATTGQNLTQVR